MSDHERSDPRTAVRRLARQERPKRFYKAATVGPGETGFGVLLDGRPLRTPARKPVVVDDAKVAAALAEEWDAQAEVIEPGTMPLTRIVNTAIDWVAGEMEAVRTDIVAHAGTDLICYRADGPDSLVEAENALWTPLLDWARGALGARLILPRGSSTFPRMRRHWPPSPRRSVPTMPSALLRCTWRRR